MWQFVWWTCKKRATRSILHWFFFVAIKNKAFVDVEHFWVTGKTVQSQQALNPQDDPSQWASKKTRTFGWRPKENSRERTKEISDDEETPAIRELTLSPEPFLLKRDEIDFFPFRNVSSVRSFRISSRFWPWVMELSFLVQSRQLQEREKEDLKRRKNFGDQRHIP